MSSRPWYAWFPADYRAKTSHLTFEQDSAYRRMIDAYYERRTPLPADPAALYRLCGAQSTGERQAIESVAKEFFTNGDGLLRHARCDEQIAKEGKLIEEWREAGKRGAQKRWGNDRVGHRVAHQNPNGVAIASYTHTYPQPQTQPQTHSAAVDLDSHSPKRKTTARAAPFVLPEWIPENQWNAWVEARTKRKNPPTNWAKKLAVNRLADLRDQGHSPALVLAESAFNGWAGLFEPKGKK